jgi:DNA-binding NarL/FixJ family response regulator
LHLVKPIKILIAEAPGAGKGALAALAERAADLALVGEASDGAKLTAIARRHQPDVVLLDLATPGLDGLALLPKILGDCPAAQGVVLGQPDCDACFLDALCAGAQAYLASDCEEDEVLRVIRAVARGEWALPPTAVRRLIEELRRLRGLARPRPADGFGDPLTERENDILRLIIEGLGNREIGGALNLAEGTVKNYVSRILEKVNARSRTELAVRALNRRLD